MFSTGQGNITLRVTGKDTVGYFFRLRLERRTGKYLSKMGAPDWMSTSSSHRKTKFFDQCKYKIIPTK